MPIPDKKPPAALLAFLVVTFHSFIYCAVDKGGCAFPHIGGVLLYFGIKRMLNRYVVISFLMCIFGIDWFLPFGNNLFNIFCHSFIIFESVKGTVFDASHISAHIKTYSLYQTGRSRIGTEGIAVHHGSYQHIYYTGRIYTPGLCTDTGKNGGGAEKYEDRIIETPAAMRYKTAVWQQDFFHKRYRKGTKAGF